MTDPYEHLRTPSAYDDMIRPLLAAKEAAARNCHVSTGTEALWLGRVVRDINDAIASLINAHGWDGDEPRT